MFTAEERARLRNDILTFAQNDARISGAAITGSLAADREDQWSDIDLAFGVADAADVPKVLADWTRHLYDSYGAVHHLDVHAGPWIYRVFLLPGTLQVDLAFVPEPEFRALAPTFRLVFGKASEPRHLPSPSPADLVALGWLYALHARTCIARRQFWQAEYMISGVRDHAFAAACARLGLPTAHGRGFDQLPSSVTTRFRESLVRELDAAELLRAFRFAIAGLLCEMEEIDPQLAERLRGPLCSLPETCSLAQ